MLSNDTVNGLFELFGAFFSWRNAYQLYRDREIKGVYWPSWVFFAGWGLWNLYYYPSLGQWHSFAAGAVLTAGTIVWVFIAARVAWHERQARRASLKRPAAAHS